MRFSGGSRASRCAAILGAAVLTGGMGEPGSGIQLELRPRVCTLAANERQCSTTVHAKWHSPREESLCLVILGRSDVKRCWEHYSEGTYNIELVFSDDQTKRSEEHTSELQSRQYLVCRLLLGNK